MTFDTSQPREFRYRWPVVLASPFGISSITEAGLVEEQIGAFDDPENGPSTESEKAALTLGEQQALTKPEGT